MAWPLPFRTEVRNLSNWSGGKRRRSNTTPPGLTMSRPWHAAQVSAYMSRPWSSLAARADVPMKAAAHDIAMRTARQREKRISIRCRSFVSHPHPTLPPQGGGSMRQRLAFWCSLPPCGGGLGGGVHTSAIRRPHLLLAQPGDADGRRPCPNHPADAAAAPPDLPP